MGLFKPMQNRQVHQQVADIAAKTLETRREEMYNALLAKLSKLYTLE